MAKKAEATKDPGATARENWDRYVYGRLRGHDSYVKHAKRLEEFYLGGGRQWTREDRAEIEGSGRPCIEINTIFPAINTAIGDQLKSRVDISMRPRNSETDQSTADTLTKVAKQTCDDIRYQWLESQMFADGMIEQRGFIELYMDFSENAMGVIKGEDLDPLDVLIDPDANSYDPDNWADVCVLRWMLPGQIRQLFGDALGDQVEERETRTGDGQDAVILRNSFGDDSDSTSVAGARDSGRTWTINGITRYLIIFRQHRKYELTDVLINPDGKIDMLDRYTPEEVQARLAQGDIRDKRVMRRIRWTVSTSDVLLHDEWSPYRTFTIIPYFPYFRRGKTIGAVDNAMSPQELLNKTTSQFLHITNTSANSGWKVEDGSLVGMRPEDLKDQGAKSGLVLVFKKGATPPEKILPNPVPAGIDRIADKAEGHIKTITGFSDSMQGLQSNATSGRQEEARQYQGKTQLAGPLDNLARSRNLVGRKILELIQDFYTEQRVFLITDQSDPSQTKYSKIIVNQRMPNGVVLNHLAVGDYDVVISDQPAMATFEDNQYRQALEMRKEGVMIPDPFVVESSSLTKKADIIKAMSANQKTDPEAEAKAKEIEAKIRNLDAITKRTEVETVNKAVEAQYSAMQAANVIAAVPQTAPVADALLLSAGFVDQDQPPIVPSLPGQGQGAAMLAGIPHNTNPMTPANPGFGLNQGIETPANDMGGL